MTPNLMLRWTGRVWCASVEHVRGIILAGGTGSRLLPLTAGVSKQLMPVYDKPMIYYPLSTLMLAGIRDILIITTAEHLSAFQRVLGSGEGFGVDLTYVVQPSPDGIAQALLLGESFVAGDRVALVLGDNLLYWPEMGEQLGCFRDLEGAAVFGHWVDDPSAFGVVEIALDGCALSFEEKPTRPRSNLAVPGLYFYDNTAVERAKALAPSARGELEITDLNRSYLDDGCLRVEVLRRGTIWLDTGTVDDLWSAGEVIRAAQLERGRLIGSPEEVAWRMGYISAEDVRSSTEPLLRTGYGRFLHNMVKDDLGQGGSL